MNGDELYQRISAGDERAFAELHVLYKVQLLSYAKSYLQELSEAKDVVSESFMALWRWRKNVRSDQHLRNFLFVTVRHKAINFLVTKERYVTLLDRVFENKQELEQIDAEEVEVELLDLLRQAVKTLPVEYQRVFELSYDRQFTPIEIARMLSMNPATVRTHKKRAIQLIKEWVQKNAPLLLLLIHHFTVRLFFLQIF